MASAYKKLDLSDEQTKSYHDQGFVIIENVLTEAEVDFFVNHEANHDSSEDRGLQNHIQDPKRYKTIQKHSSN